LAAKIDRDDDLSAQVDEAANNVRDQRNVSHLLVAQDFLNLQNGHAKIVSIEEKVRNC